MRIKRRSLLVSTAALAVTGLASSNGRASSAVTVLGGPAFGSTWRVVMPNGDAAKSVDALVTAVVADTDRSMSPYLEESELTRFNRAAADAWQRCSPDLTFVASAALAMARFTGGAFDPTVGPIVGRLGFGPITGAKARPQDLEVGATGMRKTVPGLTLDLCGIAKGHALDRITDGLKAIGVTSALVELGGEVRGLGDHPDGRPWRVGIARPDGAAGAVQRIVAPKGLALATSGNDRQGIEFGPRGITHLIDPRVGHSVPAAPASVSVLADSAMLADALATALMVLGPERGPQFAREQAIRALFVNRDGEGWRDTMTAGFDRHVLT
jgi:thiamine biosynthesis lipoprotein